MGIVGGRSCSDLSVYRRLAQPHTWIRLSSIGVLHASHGSATSVSTAYPIISTSAAIRTHELVGIPRRSRSSPLGRLGSPDRPSLCRTFLFLPWSMSTYLIFAFFTPVIPPSRRLGSFIMLYATPFTMCRGADSTTDLARSY